MTVTLIGGEMLPWSDLDGTHGPAPAGAAELRPLLAQAEGRVLFAGPHDPALLAGFPQASVLVRGLGDAEALVESHPELTIFCGSLEKMAAVAAYDTVVALDGLDRLISAEAEDRSWEETLGLLVALVRPGGRMLLGAENDFGLHRLVALPPSPTDADWVVTGERTPAGPARLTERISAAGLTVDRMYAHFSGVLVSPAILADASLGGFLTATLSAAYARAEDSSAGTVPLADPVRLATGALRHGLAADLAPAWLIIATRENTRENTRETPAAEPLPGAPDLGSPDLGAPDLGSPDLGAPDRGSPVLGATADVGPDAVIAVGGAAREIWLDRDELPRGRTLLDLIQGACRRRDLPAVREMVSAWMDGPAAGVPADQVVVGAGGEPEALAAAGAPLVALRRLAAALIAAGDAGLWPAPADEAELTALLAGMTGRELTPQEVPPLAGAASRPGVRELLADRERLTRELGEARAKHEWYEQMLRSREAELKRVQKINAVLSATLPGRTVLAVARRVKRVIRR